MLTATTCGPYHGRSGRADKFAKQLELKVRDLQRADGTADKPLSIDFYSPEKDEFVGQSMEQKVDHPEVEDWSDIPDEKRDQIKSTALDQIKSNCCFPLALAVRNLSSSGVRNVYLELKISSSTKNLQISEREFGEVGGLVAWQRTMFTHARLKNSRSSKFAHRSKLAMFDSDELQRDEDGWRFSTEYEALQPQRIRLLKPVLYVYTSESAELSIRVRVFADSFAEPYEVELSVKIVVKDRKIKIETLLPDLNELLADEENETEWEIDS